MTLPFAPTSQPGIKRSNQVTSVTSASPNAHAIQLPEYGIYLATFQVWEFNKNNMASQTAHIIYDAPLGNTSFMVRKTNLVGALASSSSEITSLTVSDPSTTGVLTVTLTHTHSGSVGSHCRAVLYELVGPQEWGF